MSKTKRVKHKELEVEFGDEIRRIEGEAKLALPEPTSGLEKKVSLDLNELAHIAPNVAIAEAWRSIETSAKQLIHSRGIEVDYDVPIAY